MSLTKNEMLALLPDNTTGEISAKDMRDIVTGLSAHDETAEDRVKLNHITVNKNVNLDTIHDNGSMFSLEIGAGPVPTHVNSYAPIYLETPQVIGNDPAINEDRPDLITIGNVYKLFYSLGDSKPPIPLENKGYTAGDMRAMKMGATYKIAIEPTAGTPGSTVLDVLASATHNFGIKHAGHPHINGYLMRIGATVWTIIVQEWTGTLNQPTLMYLLDLDPDWPDHHGIGSLPATSFRSEVLELETSIGDRNAFGADTVVKKIQELELLVDTASRHISDIQGATPTHVNIVEEFTVNVNNNGAHYCVIHDTPESHVGVDLFDGNVHKVKFEWAIGFDPCDFAADGNDHNTWCDIATPRPALWVRQGAVFRKLIDPTTDTAMVYGTVYAFILVGSIVSLKWDAPSNTMHVVKVEHGTAHTHTQDTAMLKNNGSTAYKEIPEANAANGALFVDSADHILKFKDHTGTVKAVNLTH